ncbi:MAG: alpha/beta fold hydrolase [Lawsonella sp.]|nr:alpha/beta hydrolase [Mycobacteriales bacterium]
MLKSRRILVATVAVVGLSLGLTTSAIAAPTITPLPDMPSNVLRASTEGHAPAAGSVMTALLTKRASNVAPEGANDWNCRPTADKPRPVVLLHGMGMTAYTAWSSMAPELKKEGYCVFAPNLPFEVQDASTAALGLVNMNLGGLVDIFQSTEFAAAFVKEVLTATGAEKVDIVGYSEGGTVVNVMAHTYDMSQVGKIITIGGINTGINPLGLQNKGVLYQDGGEATAFGNIGEFFSIAGLQMMTGSPVINKATENGDTVAGLVYVNIGSADDQYVKLSSENPNFQKAVPGAKVTNISLQDGCKVDDSGHLELPYNTRSWALILNALAGKHVRDVPCNPIKNGASADLAARK